jgi:membrane protease YdiL (CAAX protease family)
MNDNNEIIEFEDLFKDEIKERNEPPKPEDKKNYVYAIFSYLLVMFVLNALLLVAFSNIPNAIKEYTKDEIVLENIIIDVSGIALMETDTYDLYKQAYNGYAESLYTYQGYEIIYNTSNTYIEDLLLIKNDNDDIIGFNEDTFLSIFADDANLVNYWDTEKTLEITRYQTDDQLLPAYFITENVEFIDYTGSSLSPFYQSLYQIVLYVILLLLLLRFLMHDLTYDFKLFKLVKNQWLVIIVTGYLYVMLGNYFSNFISTLLSNAFSMPINESINQISIVRMLNSEGVVFIVLSAVVIGPIVEELVFRKSIFGLIHNPKVALVISSLVFGAIHLTAEASIVTALINGVSYFTIGLVFGYIYIKNNKNIMAPIVVHILSNLISVIASIILF